MYLVPQRIRARAYHWHGIGITSLEQRSDTVRSGAIAQVEYTDSSFGG
jgi:hypothetical protein